NIKSEVPKNAMHLLNHAYINALCEIIIHSQTEEEVKLNTRIVSKFFYDGWEKLRGF
ncbi:TetR/AcrR family transcriptional regulator, partial [Streptococcus pyogenes]